MSLDKKRELIDSLEKPHSLRLQCQLLGLNRSSWYYEPRPISPKRLLLMNRIDEIFTEYPFLGSRKIKEELIKEGWFVGRDIVLSLMREMGLVPVYPKPKLSQKHPQHKIYPYLLRGVVIARPNQVWSTDITYIRACRGFYYLVAVLDWFSRYVLSWRLSNSLETNFCIEALEEALDKGMPDIFNTDQGSQFTSDEFTGILLEKNIEISMDGRGRALDNIFVERLWRSVKYEEVYLKDYQSGRETKEGLTRYFTYYNQKRLHQSLSYKTPYEVHYSHNREN